MYHPLMVARGGAQWQNITPAVDDLTSTSTLPRIPDISEAKDLKEVGNSRGDVQSVDGGAQRYNTAPAINDLASTRTLLRIPNVSEAKV